MKTRLHALCATSCLVLTGLLSGATAFGQAPPPVSDPSGSTMTSTTPPPTNSTSSGAAWDLTSFEIHAATNVLVTVTPGAGPMPEILAALVDPSQPGGFSCSLVTQDHVESMFVNGTVDPIGNYDVEIRRANALMLSLYSPLAPPIEDRSSWSQFWSEYWYYATNPTAMDQDLEYAYYGAMGTAVVSASAAGTLAVAPYAWSAYMSAASTEMFTLSLTIPPMTVFAMEGVAATGGGIAVSWTVTAAQIYMIEAAALGTVYMTTQGPLFGAEAEIAAAHAEVLELEAAIADAEAFIASEQAAAAEGLTSISIDEIISIQSDMVLAEQEIAAYWEYINFLLQCCF